VTSGTTRADAERPPIVGRGERRASRSTSRIQQAEPSVRCRVPDSEARELFSSMGYTPALGETEKLLADALATAK
jgi:hypothetical protein